jgi:hypothetical protein
VPDVVGFCDGECHAPAKTWVLGDCLVEPTELITVCETGVTLRFESLCRV